MKIYNLNKSIKKSNYLSRRFVFFLFTVYVTTGLFYGQAADNDKFKILVDKSHVSQVNSVAISPEKGLLASAGGNIILWNADTNAFSKELSNKESQQFVAFSPTQQILASCSSEHLTLWSIQSGRILKKYKPGCYGSNAIAFSPDGKLLASTQWKTITIWNLETGQEKQIKGHNPNLSVDFSPDGNYLATSGSDSEFPIKIWDVNTWQLRNKLRGHTMNGLNEIRVWSVKFSPDGEKIATASFDNTVKIWNWKSKEPLEPSLSINGFSDLRRAIAFSPDGTRIATSGDGQIKFWDTSTGEYISTLGEKYDNRTLSMKFIDNLLVSGGTRNITFWDINTGNKKKVLGYGKIELFNFSDSRNMLAVQIGSSLRLLDLKSYQFDTLFQDKYEKSYSGLVFSPDEKLLAVITSPWRDEPKEVIVWNIEAKQIIDRYEIDNTSPDWIKNNKFNNTITTKTKDLKAINVNTVLNLIDPGNDKKIIASIAFLEGDNWAVLTPEGLFDASENGFNYLHYIYGENTINLEQLKDTYYKPKLLQSLLSNTPNPPKPVVPLEKTALYPEVIDEKFDQKTSKLKLKIKSRGGGVGNIEVYVNNTIVVADARTEALKINPYIKTDEIVELTVDLSQISFLKGQENIIKVVTSNYLKSLGKGNIQSVQKKLTFVDKNKILELPNFYGIVVGVSKYTDVPNRTINLAYTDDGAEAFSNALKLGANRLLCPSQKEKCKKKIDIKTFSTSRKTLAEQPTKENIKKAFAEIASKAKPEDILVIYLSGHGVSLKNRLGSYFFVTKGMDSLKQIHLEKKIETNLISGEEILDWLSADLNNSDDIFIRANKKVIILDTCVSGNFAKLDKGKKGSDNPTSDQIRAFAHISGKTGTITIMGSEADKSSFESGRYDQSLLTYALLEGLKGDGLRKPGDIFVRKLFDYAEKRVPSLAQDIGRKQTPVIKQPSDSKDFIIGQLTTSDIKNLSFKLPKPLLGRPNFFNDDEYGDNLELEVKLENKLKDESDYYIANDRYRMNPIWFYTEGGNSNEKLRITGKYTFQNGVVKLKARFKHGKNHTDFPELIGTEEVVLETLIKLLRKEICGLYQEVCTTAKL